VIDEGILNDWLIVAARRMWACFTAAGPKQQAAVFSDGHAGNTRIVS